MRIRRSSGSGCSRATIAHPTTRRGRGLSCQPARGERRRSRSRGGGFHALPSVRSHRAAGVGGGLRLLADGGRPLRGHRGRRGGPGDPPRARPRRELRRHRARLRRRPLRGGGRARARDPPQGRDPGHQVRGEGAPARPARPPARREPGQHPARGRREPEAPAHRLGGRAARALARRGHARSRRRCAPSTRWWPPAARASSGVSNFTGAMLAECLRTRRVDVSQVGYHMLDRRQEQETFPLCLARRHRGDGLRLARPRAAHRSLHRRRPTFDPARDWRAAGVAFGQPIFRGDNLKTNVGVVERIRRGDRGAARGRGEPDRARVGARQSRDQHRAGGRAHPRRGGRQRRGGRARADRGRARRRSTRSSRGRPAACGSSPRCGRRWSRGARSSPRGASSASAATCRRRGSARRCGPSS